MLGLRVLRFIFRVIFWVVSPPSNCGKWRFSSGSPILKMWQNPGGDWNPGRGVNPNHIQQRTSTFFPFLVLAFELLPHRSRLAKGLQKNGRIGFFGFFLLPRKMFTRQTSGRTWGVWLLDILKTATTTTTTTTTTTASVCNGMSLILENPPMFTLPNCFLHICPFSIFEMSLGIVACIEDLQLSSLGDSKLSFVPGSEFFIPINPKKIINNSSCWNSSRKAYMYSSTCMSNNVCI